MLKNKVGRVIKLLGSCGQRLHYASPVHAEHFEILKDETRESRTSFFLFSFFFMKKNRTFMYYRVESG